MSFLTPLFWLGLAAAAVPIVVHLVRRSRAPRVEFPSLMFVRRVPQRTVRRRHLRNILLLILRLLALLLLVLAFVRPYFESGGAGLGDRRRAEVVLLDRSFSMRFDNRFERAVARARSIICNGAGDGSNVSRGLVLFDDGYQVASRPTSNVVELNARLGEVAAGYRATDYAQALAAAEALLRDFPAAEKRIHLVTDFQATAATGLVGQMVGKLVAGTAANGPSGYRPGRGITIVPVDIGSREGANLAITGLNATPVIYQPKYTDRVAARIENFGPEPVDGVRVELRLNDRTVEKRVVRIAARDAATVEFTGFNLNEGQNLCQIVVEGDNFPADNSFVFSLRRAVKSKALIIETASRNQSESFYLKNALTTGENNPFEVEVKSAGGVNPAEIAAYRLIIINDATISPVLATEILRQVSGGTGLIIAAGAHTEATEANGFNRAFEQALRVRLEGAAELRGGYVVLSEIKPDHAIFEPFQESGRPPAAKMYGYRRVAASEQAVVLARYEDGAAALIESASGRGKILLLTTTLDASWTDLPLKPSYLPLIRQMTRYLVEGELPAWHLVGQPVPLRRTTEGQPPLIDTPGGVRLPASGNTRNDGEVLTPLEPGFYRLRYPESSELLAVNIPGRESDLARIEAPTLMATLSAAPPGGEQTGTAPESEAGKPTGEKQTGIEIESRQRIWFYLLIAALLLFITEGIIARRIRLAKIIDQTSR